ncbi:hypothetical protein [Piscinibacter sakaiensis]|uniref:hypothetical protein n=1 Tax=Piscinibacter sakaiensis TaxID=1547922 RepID=UPI003AAEBA0C
MLGAGWLGYQRGFDGELPTPQVVSIADPRATQDAAEPPPVPAAGGAATGQQRPAPDAEQQLRWPLWEFQLAQPIPPRNPPLTPPGWRLLGATMTSDGWKVAVLKQDTRQTEFFGLGATLPGGYVIKAISDEDVTLVVDKREVVLSFTGSR